MANYPTPVTPTLLQISTNDFINYQGVQYAVASVVSTSGGTDTNLGQFTSVITITTTPGTVTLTLTSADTIVSNTYIDQAGVAHTIWAQTAAYT